ncbi:MAG: hypothetical protein L0Z53_06235, partial [Acidobacteriales bacterium]|nr:hypothetical protein [Terriglobales bacterium]
LTPEEMMIALHASYPDDVRAKFRRASIDGLRSHYQQNRGHPKVHEAQLAMESAISTWSAEEVADFLINHLCQEPQSTYLRGKSPVELRQIFVEIYNYLFSGKDS